MDPTYLFDKLAKKVDAVVVSSTTNNTNQIKFSNNKIVSTTTVHRNEISVFINDKKRIASTTLEGGADNPDQIVKNLLTFAKKLRKKSDYHGIAEGPFKYQNVKNSFDPKIVDIQDGGVDIVDKNINSVLDHGAKRCDGIFETNSFQRQLLTSNEVNVADKGTDAYFSVRAFVDKNATGHQSVCSRMLKLLDDENKARKAAEIANKAAYPEKVAPGKYDVVFSPLAFGNILQHIGEAASIFSVESGLSFLADKQGKTLAPEFVTITDNGSMENGYHSTKFDDEGTPTGETRMIDQGRLNSFLHNASTAKKYKAESTGNAGLISPEPWNIELKPGDHNESELFGQVKKGIYITNLWYTRFSNYASGDFSTIPRDGAFFIDNGEIKYPVSGMRVSENVLNILKNISALGKQQERVVGWEVETPVVAPMVLAKDINISTSTQ